jgi:hypothetical protein
MVTKVEMRGGSDIGRVGLAEPIKSGSRSLDELSSVARSWTHELMSVPGHAAGTGFITEQVHLDGR